MLSLVKPGNLARRETLPDWGIADRFDHRSHSLQETNSHVGAEISH